MTHDEGYIKFNLEWEKQSFDFPGPLFHTIQTWRQKLFAMNLVGAYPNGIGFGNLSIRYQQNQFIITGSATGNFKQLTKRHYALVKNFNLDKNTLYAVGETKASSESLSHAAIYQANKEVNAVIHIHHQKFWEKYIHKLPTTPQNAAFGTPEMAHEISKLATQEKGIIIMGGHAEGIIAYGKSLNEAGKIIINHYQKI